MVNAMKILHTSDLHLGDTWRGITRIPDQLRVLNEIFYLCAAHQVDMLLVTGDIFGDRLEGKLSDIARQFLQLIHDRLEADQVVFLLRGNHDSLGFFQLLRVLVNEWAVPYRVPLVIADREDVYRIPGKNLQVVALPHLRYSMIGPQVPPDGLTPEERIKLYEGGLAYKVGLLSQSVDLQVPAIFAGHILLRGARYNDERIVEEGTLRDPILSSRDLPEYTIYNALGHIHLSQPVRIQKFPPGTRAALTAWTLASETTNHRFCWSPPSISGLSLHR